MELAGLILDEAIENNVETGEKNFYRTIVDNIRTIRIQKGISIEALAINTGVDKSHLYRVEKGSKKIGLDALRRIAVVLEVPLSRLLVNATTIEEREEIREIDLILHSLDHNEIIYFQRMMKAYYKEKVNDTFTKGKKISGSI